MNITIHEGKDTFPESLGIKPLKADLLQIRILKIFWTHIIYSKEVEDAGLIKDVLKLTDDPQEIALIIKAYAIVFDFILETQKKVDFEQQIAGICIHKGKIYKNIDEVYKVLLKETETEELELLAKLAEDEYM